MIFLKYNIIVTCWFSLFCWNSSFCNFHKINIFMSFKQRRVLRTKGGGNTEPNQARYIVLSVQTHLLTPLFLRKLLVFSVLLYPTIGQIQGLNNIMKPTVYCYVLLSEVLRIVSPHPWISSPLIMFSLMLPLPLQGVAGILVPTLALCTYSEKHCVFER